MKYEATHQKYLDFIEEYKQASNAATGSEVDANANVEQKNVATMASEIHKKDNIKINRLAMQKMIRDMFGEDLANEYIRQLDAHEIYRHDESGLLFPYCVSVTMYPFLFHGMEKIGGCAKAPTHLSSFAGNFINLVFAISSQFLGAVSTPEVWLYLDYFIRKEYGDDYYLHTDKIVDDSNRHRTIHKVITDVFEQIVYSLNQPAAARGFQSVFWNVAYYDHPYFDGMFGDFIFPDGTKPIWESLSWLQKAFMKWFNKERLRAPLTFPVETLNLLDDGEKYVDAEWADFASEMWAEGHSFFLYRSDSVDSLSSCCLDGDTFVATRNAKGILNFVTIKDLWDGPDFAKDGLEVFHDGNWVKAKLVCLPKRDMYLVTTVNNKSVCVTDNHLFPTLRGDVQAIDLREDDYIQFVSPQATPEDFAGSQFYPYGFTQEYAEFLNTAYGVNTFKRIDSVCNMHLNPIVPDGGDEHNDMYHYSNGKMYFRVKSIEPSTTEYENVYCFEIEDGEPYFTLPNGMISHNCRLRNELQDNTFSYTLGAGGVSTGSKAVITMNINRLVQNAVRDGKDISEAVREQTRKIHKYLMAYNEIVRNFFNSRMLPVYDAGFISMEKQYLTIGINGFVEGAEFLGINPCPNDQYFAYGEMILKPIYEENKKARTKELMFNTECVPAENLGVKNAAWDKKDGYFVPRDCYNSYFYIVEDETSNLLDKFILHGDRMTRYLDGGSALHANLDEHLSKAQYRRLMDVAIKTKCPYFTYNIPNTVCNDCGFISKHRLTECPKCHSRNLDYLTRVIGYLKRVSAFSQARQEEEKRRYYEKV